jgi:hypothetical protein
MPLPEHLERLKHISIDTLDLSESTTAILKWYGITSILDCLVFFYKSAHQREIENSWLKLFAVMFGEVKPVLIAAGCWDLVLDADVWQVFREQRDKTPRRRIVRWQSRDQDLYEIPIEQLGIPNPPADGHFFTNVGQWIDHFQALLKGFSGYVYWLQIGMSLNSTAAEFLSVREYVFGIMQPRLVELGYWTFVEDHIDDWE